jgi:fructose-1,6-bisphosphatase/inositol monophosphatase family enzyme
MNLDNNFLFQAVFAILQDVYGRRLRLGSRIAEEVERTGTGKRQSRLEKMVYDMLPEALRRAGVRNFSLAVEGYQEITVGQPTMRIFVDPEDGTSNTARGIETGARDIISDFAIFVAIAPEKEDLRFGDFLLGAGLDWRSGQTWIAARGLGAFTFLYGEVVRRRLVPKRHYHRHNPLLACEFYRHVNWATRLLINHAVEWSDMASSFMNILRVPLGEVDCFFNNVVPAVSTEGQRGHELGAIAPFLSELQGYAIDTRTGNSLLESPFTFNGGTPVIVGVDQRTAEYYREMVEHNLNRPVPGFTRLTTVCDLIRTLHQTVGVSPWSLRELA